jgi:hypothetical protein
MIVYKILLVVFALSVTVPSRATALDRSALSLSERVELDHFIDTEVRADLNANFETRIADVSKMAENALLMGEPMTPETRAVLTDGVYRVLFAALAKQGHYLSRHDFNVNVGKSLDFISRLGFFPRAFTVGYMGRFQRGIGGSAGTQFNFYFEHGKLKMSSYTVLGVQAGYQGKIPSTMQKIELYAAFCFGSCVGGSAVGYYLGVDGYASVGAGGGAFIEAGLDVTDFYQYRNAGKNYSIKDLYQAKAIYVGFGFDIGFGAGVAVNAFKYSMDYEKTIGDLNDPLLSVKVSEQKLH